MWQVIAIIALIAATAGWTTVASRSALASRPETGRRREPDRLGRRRAAVATTPSVPPVADTHDAPELEASLPREFKGSTLQVQSCDRRRDPDRRRHLEQHRHGPS